MREIDKREKGLNIQADSVVVQGKVKIVDDPDEKIKLMRVLLMLHNEQAAELKVLCPYYDITPTKVTDFESGDDRRVF